MFDIKVGENGEVVLSGRFDASHVAKAGKVFDEIEDPKDVDLSALDYISSAGLGVLLKTQKRLMDGAGAGLKLTHVRPHIHDIFRYSGFDQIFEIQAE